MSYNLTDPFISRISRIISDKTVSSGKRPTLITLNPEQKSKVAETGPVCLSDDLVRLSEQVPEATTKVRLAVRFRYLVGTTNLGLWYRKDKKFNLTAYCDTDYAGDKIERKSTNGACQFLGQALISWSCRKQNTIALSTTEAEYVSAASSCSQVLWIKNQLEDYSVRYFYQTVGRRQI
ncbi:hypothetical protein MTR_1g051400 [Medicago truncatula]|uniref:RNA-directed DNA polymerase n=1 Tax=Medicago truncatula TaxID=3880 RepID=A0A072VTP9_MEDTR|nr:hypothetical protein MTR_1g051400 [Medicago truncatula]